ncbi:MAG: hypothetical protein ACETWQ_16055 [Phycisphaerae bacterium]
MIVVGLVIVVHVYHTDRLINAGTVDVFAQQAAVIIFGDNVAAIIDVFDYVTANDILFDAPAGRVIFAGANVIVI